MKKFVLFVFIVVAVLVALRARYEQRHPRQPEPPPGVPVTTTTQPEAPAATTSTQPPMVPPPPPSTKLDRGANAFVSGALELYPTYSAVGLEMSYQGDANTNVSALMSWRRVGESGWRDGVDVTIDRERHLMWASIWPLEQNEPIEVKLAFSDPEPLPEPRLMQTRTRRMVLNTVGGRTLYVSPTVGDDDNPGTKAAPLKTLAKATTGLKSGDTVYAMSGVYPESLHLQYIKAQEGKPAVITAAPGHKPVLDSSRVIRAGAGWSQVSPGIYSIGGNFPDDGPHYVAQDGKRMFFYPTVADLTREEYQNRRCWAYDPQKKRLLVRTGDAKSPGSHSYHVAMDDYGFYLEGCKYVVISGFEICHYGNSAIRISGSGTIGNVVYGNLVHNAQQGIFVKTETSENNAIWYNTVAEPGIRDFSWISIKHSEYSRQGIIVWCAGRGNSVCHNKVHDWFDCIDVESWLHPNDLGMNRDADIMFNQMWNVGDDGVELDGGGINMRFHGNRIRSAHSAISLAPVERGPVYVTRNDATYHTLFLKMSVGSDSVGWTYIYNNSAYTMDKADGASMVRFNSYELADRNRVLKNNAMIGSEFAVNRGRTGHVLDYNCYYNTPTKPFRKFDWEGQVYRSLAEFQQSTGQEQHGMYADPMFTSTPDLGKYGEDELPVYDNPSVGDLRPAPGSPLIDRGVVIRGVSDVFKGAAPDIGAFEVGDGSGAK
ncbi:MAG: hypothetical protein K8T26_08000 [Lentisphaerae bacterium]|nr:hypothetical protein [Lentisphaerota bacterium]